MNFRRKAAEVVRHVDYGWVLPALGRLPTGLAQRMADFRGDLTYLLRAPSRKKAIENLQIAFPRLSRGRVKQIARQTFRTLSHDEMESYWFDRPLTWLRDLVRVEGTEELEEAIHSGQGVLLFTGHVGSTGMFITVLGKMGIPINLVFRSLEDVPSMPRPWYRYGNMRISRLEAAVQRPIIWAGRSHYFNMRRKLREGEIVLMGLDVVPYFVKKTVTVNFFRQACRFPDGLARLYQDTGARLVLWFVHQNPSRIHEMQLQDVTSAVAGLESREAITQALVALFEEHLRRYPGDWLEWEAFHQFLAQD